MVFSIYDRIYGIEERELESLRADKITKKNKGLK